MHAVDREVAREHAPVGAEQLDRVEDPRRERAAAIDCIGIARPDSLHVTFSRRPARAAMPVFQSSYSSGSFDRGHPVCSTTTGSSQPSSAAAAGDELVGVGHELEDETAVLQRLQDRRRGKRLVALAHDPDAAEALRRHLLVELALDLGGRRRSGRGHR